MDRKNCTHTPDGTTVIFVSWCRRCSGWRVSRAEVASGLPSVSVSLVHSESHFLPQEETSPDELNHLIQRAFLVAQELGGHKSA